MKEAKIIAANGRFSIITSRDKEHRFSGKINHISSTEPQPYIAANFEADGALIGGRTMSESIAKNTIKKAFEAGMKIEGGI